MTSLNFPKMFAANRTQTTADNTATLQNAKLILKSEQKEFFGNPEFGTALVTQLFKNNAPILKTVVADVIYTTLSAYIPQCNIDRNKIEVTQDVTSLYVTVPIYKNSTGTDESLSINLIKDNTQFGENY